MSLTDQQLLRYTRQILLPEFDVDGQRRLLDSRVTLFGLGGLGSPVAMYLASSGVGHMTLVDPDQVSLSNLQRQIVHTTESIGHDKTESARDNLMQINPEIEYQTINTAPDDQQLEQLIADADLVLDCTDRFSVRYKLNAACYRQQTAYLSAAVERWQGYVMGFRFDQQQSGPCFQCLYPQHEVSEPTRSCADTGVVSAVAGMIGCIQATEAIKFLLNLDQSLDRFLLTVDARSIQSRKIALVADAECTVCA